MKLPRNPNVTQTFGKKTSAFKDQREGRGGSRNTQSEYLSDCEAASSGLKLVTVKHVDCDCMSCLPWNY